MQGLNEITTGMTPQERQAYLDHQAMRARQEQERQESLIADHKRYKERLIESILKNRPGVVWTREQLQSRSVSFLERIA